MTQDKDEDREKLEGRYNIGEPTPSDPRDNRLVTFPVLEKELTLFEIEMIMMKSDRFEDFLNTLGKRSYGIHYNRKTDSEDPKDVISLFSDRVSGETREEFVPHKWYVVDYDSYDVHHKETYHYEMPAHAAYDFY